jgi:hypothetical protein
MIGISSVYREQSGQSRAPGEGRTQEGRVGGSETDKASERGPEQIENGLALTEGNDDDIGMDNATAAHGDESTSVPSFVLGQAPKKRGRMRRINNTKIPLTLLHLEDATSCGM